MGDAGWGYGGLSERDTGVSQVLQAYATQGGQLFGARRWAENPLTLTHVRWVGPTGAMLDGFRRPQDDDDQIPPEEREVWVELALHFPATHPSGAGFDAPWLPLSVDLAQASGWAQAVRHARNAQRFSPQAGSAPQYPAYPQSYPQGYPQNYPVTPGPGPAPGQSPWRVPEPAQHIPDSQAGWSDPRRVSGAPLPSGFYGGDPRLAGAAPPMAPDGASDGPWAVPINSVPPPMPPVPPAPAPGWPDTRQQLPWESAQGELPEIALLPSVEIELPPLMPAGGPVGRREFSRDTALVFARALRPLPQVRELRGWMRGERLVLAACYIAGIGTRAATYAEMESATRQVADALARHTLPYAWLGFAEPGEWTQGAILPE